MKESSTQSQNDQRILNGYSAGNSTVTMPDIGSLQPFNVKGDPHSISQLWKKWKRSFQLYLAGKEIASTTHKRELLLHTAGLDVQEIYFTLVNEEIEENCEGTLKVLDDYFLSKSNTPFERHLFRQIVQSSEETVDQFASSQTACSYMRILRTRG